MKKLILAVSIALCSATASHANGSINAAAAMTVAKALCGVPIERVELLDAYAKVASEMNVHFKIAAELVMAEAMNGLRIMEANPSVAEKFCERAHEINLKYHNGR